MLVFKTIAAIIIACKAKICIQKMLTKIILKKITETL